MKNIIGFRVNNKYNKITIHRLSNVQEIPTDLTVQTPSMFLKTCKQSSFNV